MSIITKWLNINEIEYEIINLKLNLTTTNREFIFTLQFNDDQWLYRVWCVWVALNTAQITKIWN